MEEHEAAEALRKQQATDAAAEAQRLAAGQGKNLSLDSACPQPCGSAINGFRIDVCKCWTAQGRQGDDCVLRPCAEAAEKAAQAEELRARFEALSTQKAELVQQLKQVQVCSAVAGRIRGLRNQAFHDTL